MLSPKRTKFRKSMKGRMTGRAKGGDSVDFGDYGLQATECGRLTSRQIEAARVAISRHVKRGGKLYIRVFPDKPTTKKPAETRMGKGKGAAERGALDMSTPKGPKMVEIRDRSNDELSGSLDRAKDELFRLKLNRS